MFANVFKLILVVAVLQVPLAISSPNSGGGSGSTLKKSNKGRGRGVKLFDNARVRGHFSLDAGVGLNTNPYSLPADLDTIEAAAKAAGKLSPVSQKSGMDMVFKVTPDFSVSTYGRKLGINMGFKGSWDVLPDIMNGGEHVNYGLFDGSAYGDVVYNKDGKFSFNLGNTLSASRNPSELFVASNFRIHDDLKLGVDVRPGGGAFTVGLEGTYGFDYWPTADNFIIGNIANAAGVDLNSSAVNGTLLVSWQFMPQTTAKLTISGGNYALESNDKVRITPVSAMLGLSGKLSNKVTGDIALGYSNPLVAMNSKISTLNLVGIVGNANVNWEMSKSGSASLGLVRTIAPAPFFYFITSNTANIDFDYDFNNKISFGFTPSVMFLEFGLPESAAGKDARMDLGLSASLELMYHIRDWFSIGLQADTSWRWTNADIATIYGTESAYASNSGKFEFLFERTEALFVLNVNY